MSEKIENPPIQNTKSEDPNSENDLDTQLLAQMRDDFLEESHELLDQLNLQLTELEKSPNEKTILDEIFRIVHTIKGSSSFSGLNKMSTLSHKIEDTFGGIRKGEIDVDASLIDIMFEAMETLTQLRDRVSNGESNTDYDIDHILYKIEQTKSTDKTDHQEEKSSPVLPENIPEKIPEKIKPEKIKPEKINKDKSPTVPEKTKGSKTGPGTIRVPTERLDQIMNMVGELITNRNQLLGFSEGFNNDELLSIAASMDRLTGQLHDQIMRVRMVPIEDIFIKFPGVVRNLAREKGKQIDLVLEGKETELDKTVLEQIYDPLVHLLRNAVDHGLETPRERQDQGKDPAGKIRLAAKQVQDRIIIEIEDNGKGINPEIIKSHAIKKNLITPSEAQSMTDDQIIRLIFLAGFSTAEQITDTSGRGVGMDAVKDKIQKFRGLIDIKSTVGQGTTLQIQLPLTIAILKVLLVKVNGWTYALPLNSVLETLLISPNDIQTIKKQQVIFIRNQAHILKNLNTILGNKAISGWRTGNAENKNKQADKVINPNSENANRKTQIANRKSEIPIVVVGLAEKRAALCVDELLHKQEVVMKPLGNYLGNIKGIEGASILPDGSVTLIMSMEMVIV